MCGRTNPCMLGAEGGVGPAQGSLGLVRGKYGSSLCRVRGVYGARMGKDGVGMGLVWG